MKARTFLAMLVLTATAAIANAQVPVKPQQPTGQNSNCPSFVDENKNGVCDNFENGTCPYPNRQLNGKGRRNMQGGQGTNQNMRQGRRQGNGQGMGRNAAMMQRRGFKDDNKNGVCDYYEEWQKTQQNTEKTK